MPNVARRLGPRGRVLDLGCGAGGNLVYLARRGFDVYGIDCSKHAIKLAREWLDEKKRCANLRVGDIYKKLPYRNGFFNAVISIRVLHHGRIGQIRHAIREIARVLKPGGLVFVTVRKETRPELRLKFKTIAPRTYVPMEGSERGVVHYLFDELGLKREFGQRFDIDEIWVERGPKRWELYYCLLGHAKTWEAKS
jgi:SAM-dependent methyltransferase